MSSEQKKNLLSSIDYWLYIRKNRRRSAWNGFVRFMACLVVFCTTYALILPAITLEYQTICGIEEHSHSDSCYELQSALICDLEETEGHIHTQEICYQAANTLTCDMDEVIAHTHSESCFHTETALTCGLEEIIEHIHADECFDEESELVCQLEEIICHTHDTDCYDPEDETMLICELEEIIEHTHSGECYTTETSQVCALEEIAVHAHTTDCYDPTGSLTCTLEEITAHAHTDTCYTEQSVFVCEQLETPAHTHGDECNGNVSVLVCTTAEHIHASECFPSEEDSGAVLLNPLSTLFTASNSNSPSSEETDATEAATEADNYPIMPTNLDNNEVKISGSGAIFDPNTGMFSVDLRLDFSLTAQEIINDNYKYSITLPSNVIVPEKVLGTAGIAADTTINNMIAFDYEFEAYEEGGETRYKVIVDFREDYVEALSQKGNANASVYISFEGKLDEDTEIENGDLILKDGDGSVTNIPITGNTFPDNQTNQHDISTSKTGSYNAATNELTYTITISSNKGTPSDVVVEDWFSTNGIEISSVSNLTITKNGNPVTQKSTEKGLNTGSDGWKLTLDKLGPGESYTITYTYKLSDVADNVTLYPNNKVTATSTDPNNQTVTSTSNISTNISKQLLSKNGSYNAETNQITWTITVNAGGNNIAGYTLTDDMLSNAQSLTISPSEGFSIDNSNGYAITFNGLNDTDSNTNTYTIVYTTGQQQSSTSTNVSNEAVLDKPNDGKDPTSSTGTAYVPAGGSIVKTAGTIDASSGTMSWTVTFNIPNGGIPATTYDYWGNPIGYIADNTGHSWGVETSHWFSKDQRSALYEALRQALPGVNFELQFSKDNYTWVSHESIAGDDTAKYHCYRITFPEGLPANAVADQKLVFTYSTTADLTNANSVTFANTAKFDNGSSTAEQKYTNSIVKMDRYYRTGTTYTSNTDGVIGWYIRVTPGTDASKIVVNDTLPDDLTLLRLGVGSDGNAASSCYGYDTGTVTGWNDIKGEYTVNDNDITINITRATAESKLPANSEIYVYVECQINSDKLPKPGESKEYRFTNKANITIDDNDQGEVTQTQIVTVNRPAAIVKMDSNANAGDETHLQINEDGTVGWYVQLYLDTEKNGPITVTDYLPADVTLSKIGIGTYASMARNHAASNVVSGNSGTLRNDNLSANYNITTNNSTQTVAVSIGDASTTFAANSYIYLYLECKLSDEQKQGGATLTNKATMGDYSDEQTQVLTPPTKEVVDKTSIWNTNINQIQYAVEIDGRGNNGEGLIPGTGDTLTVKDVMSYLYDPWWNTIHSTLIASSVKLYHAEPIEGGGYKLGAELQPNEWTWTFADGYLDLNGQRGTMTNTITATVPDGQFLVLMYAYAFNIETEYEFDFQISNSVTVTGQTTSSDQVYDNFKWDVSDVDAGITSSGTYTITKVQKGNYGMTLPGAQFSIYKYQDNAPVLKSDGTPVVYISDEDGKVYINKEDWFEEDVVYYFMETQAPAGYALPENPTKVYFYFKAVKDPAYVNLPSGTIDLTNDFGIAYIENEAPQARLVYVDKVWQDSNGNTIKAPEDVPSISFRLYQNGKLYDATPDNTTDADTVYTVEGSKDWKLTIPDLPEKDESGTPYIYTIEEIKVDGYSSAITTTTDADGFRFIITNQKEASGEITVKKLWDDNTPEEYRNPVTVQLYQVEGEIYADYTAYLNIEGNGDSISTYSAQPVKQAINKTGSGTYTLTWYPSAPVKGVNTFYIDIFDPNAVINNAFQNISNVTVSIDGNVTTFNSPDIGAEGGYFRLTFCNTYTEPDIDKSQDSMANININNSISVTFTLNSSPLPELDYETDTPITGGSPYGEPVTIGTDGTWTHTWKDLPTNGVNAKGELVNYTYYVVETTTGYNTLYSTSKSHASGVITITNEYVPPVELPYSVSLQVDKSWVDSNSNPFDAPIDSVEFELFRKESTNTNTVYLNWGPWGNGGSNGGNTTTITVPMGGTITLQFVAPAPDANDNTWSTFKQTDGTANATLNQTDKSELLGYTRHYGMNGPEDPWATYFDTYRYTYVVSVNGDGDATLSLNFHAQAPSENIHWKGIIEKNEWRDDVEIPIELGIESITVSEDLDKDWVSKGTFTLTADDDWSMILDNLEPGEYKIVEKTEGRFDTTFTVGGITTKDEAILDLNSENKSGNVTITNTVPTGELNVTKVWRDNTNSTRPLFLTFTLYQNNSVYRTFRLSGPEWTASISGLPIYDNDGNKYSYQLVENALPGYKTSYTVNSNTNSTGAHFELVDVNGNKVNADVTVTNELATDLSVEKEWFEGMTKSDVEIQLYQVLNYTNGQEPTHKSYGDAVILGPGGETDWKKTYRNLPLYAYEGDVYVGTYTYYAVETTTGYITTYSAVDADGNVVTNENVATSPAVSGGTITITNAPDVPDYTTITVEKKWLLPAGVDPTESITFKLYQHVTVDGTTTKTQYGNPYTLNAEVNWSMTLNDLPAADKYGNRYTYTVEEDDVPGFKDSYTNNKGISEGTITITNEPITNVGVNKKWESTEKKNVKIDLYQLETDQLFTGIIVENGVYEVPNLTGFKPYRSAILDDKENGGTTGWTKNFQGLPLYRFDGNGNVIGYYAYYIVEDVDGYYQTYGKNNEGRLVITNWPATTINVQKEWKNADGSAYTPSTETVKLKLMQVASSASGEPVEYAEIELSAEKGWNHSFKDLPTVATDDSGATYTYYVVEENGNVYGVTYTDSDGNDVGAENPVSSGTITVTNKVTSLTVTKIWNDGTETVTSHDPVTVNIYQAIEGQQTPDLYKTVELTDTNATATFTGLPVADTNGNPYIYTVDEVLPEDSDYVKSVSENNSSDGTYSYIITNTMEETTKISIVKKWEDGNDGGTSLINVNIYQVWSEKDPNAPSDGDEGKDNEDEGSTTDPTEPEEDTTNPSEPEETTPTTPSTPETEYVTLTINVTCPEMEEDFTRQFNCPINSTLDLVVQQMYGNSGVNTTRVINKISFNTNVINSPNYVVSTTPHYAWGTEYFPYIFTFESFKLSEKNNTVNITLSGKGNGLISDDLVADIDWLISPTITTPTSAVSYASMDDTDEQLPVYRTIQVLKSNNWTATVEDLPLYTYDSNGKISGFYSYYIKEAASVDGSYILVDYSDNNTPDGITSGTITVTNKLPSESPGYELPSTGGKGVEPMLYAGAVMFLGAAYLLYEDRKRRKRKA